MEKITSNFINYLNSLKEVNAFMTKIFICYLKKNKLYSSYEENANKFPILSKPYDIVEPRQFMGWAFDTAKTKQGAGFWNNEIIKWVIFCETTNYHKTSSYINVQSLIKKYKKEYKENRILMAFIDDFITHNNILI